MSAVTINIPLVYQERMKQLEHKLQCMSQTLKSNEGYAQIYEIYNQNKNVHQIISDTLIKVSLAMQGLKQNVGLLRTFVVEHLENIQNQLKEQFQLLLNNVQIIQHSKQCLQGMTEKILMLERSLREVNEKYNTEKERRKIMHNNLIELKGNIRVYCRIRPCLPINRQKLLNQQERVFKPQESQSAVFEEVRPLITSVLDGYNVCIMAYGQTGSGKTYTMMGPHSECETENHTELGIIPRAAEELFRLILEKPEESHSVEVSILEVYNNDLYDLLAYDSHSGLCLKRDIVIGKDGKSYVPSLTYKHAAYIEDVLDLVKKGLQLRVKHSTLIHANSSRSHLVVTLTVTTSAKSGETVDTFNSQKQKSIKTKLQLVDLAGSECVGMSGVQGVALREASFINRSLSALSDVLGALAEHRTHIPYRNSKLTHLLQDSIGGDAKLLVMLCISPCQKFTTETLQTLGFGTRACQVSRVPVKKKH
ncbi:kinesin-like protein KIF25 isoform X2 [Aquarana catesbeiana]|uniref:kinesin-like protein KIF25 isoform X2 n=1 Tax=Aquarana catesbeiana TaxID=8400 RepID=UPI003CCA3559